MITGHLIQKEPGRTLVRQIYAGHRWAEGKKALRLAMRKLGIPGLKGTLRSGKTKVTLRVTRTREVRI